jgi:hypothetical protein
MTPPFFGRLGGSNSGPLACGARSLYLTFTTLLAAATHRPGKSSDPASAADSSCVYPVLVNSIFKRIEARLAYQVCADLMEGRCCESEWAFPESIPNRNTDEDMCQRRAPDDSIYVDGQSEMQGEKTAA